MTRVKRFEMTVHTADRWVGEVAKQTGNTDRQAMGSISAVLHALRDRLPHEESANLGGQLPLMMRGVYYEGWEPSGTPEHYGEAEDFLRRVEREASLESPIEASRATRATMGVLGYDLEEREMEGVLAVLPPPIRSLLEDAPEY
jgi:uncharacterized protein (DUF2267 family)